MKTKRLLFLQACIMLFSFSAVSQIIAPGDSIKINFQPTVGVMGGSFVGAPLPTGYLGDFGNTKANHSGLTYGWSGDFTTQGRQRLDPAGTGANNPWGNCIQFNRPGSNGVWTVHLKPGYYDVRIGGGDASFTDSNNSFSVNGILAPDLTPLASNHDNIKVAGVEVKADSVLSFTSSDAANNAKVCFITIGNGVYVPREVIHVTSVKIDPSNFALFVGQSATLKTKVLPTDAADKSLVWSSDNAAVTVGLTGIINAVSLGSANVTATSTDGSIVGTCTVSVLDPATSTGTNPNLILNPGFEDGLAWWSTWGGQTLSTNPLDAATGVNACFVLDGSSGGFAQDVTLPVGGAGKTYIFKVKVKTTGMPQLAQTGCKLNEGTTELNSPSYITVENRDIPYTEFVYAVATTAATTKAQIWVWKNATGSIYLDDYSFAEVDLASGLKTNSLLESLSVYPNPAKDVVNIDFQSKIENAQVSISDLTGKSVYKNSVNSVNELRISTANFARGIYVLSISTKGETSNMKLVVQ